MKVFFRFCWMWWRWTQRLWNVQVKILFLSLYIWNWTIKGRGWYWLRHNMFLRLRMLVTWQRSYIIVICMICMDMIGMSTLTLKLFGTTLILEGTCKFENTIHWMLKSLDFAGEGHEAENLRVQTLGDWELGFYRWRPWGWESDSGWLRAWVLQVKAMRPRIWELRHCQTVERCHKG